MAEEQLDPLDQSMAGAKSTEQWLREKPQYIANAVSALNPFLEEKTEADYKPEVVDTIKNIALTVLKGKDPRANIDYPDYPSLPSGLSVADMIKDSSVREQLTEDDRKSPVFDASRAIGGATMYESPEGDVYVTDIYDFSYMPVGNVKDMYGAARYAAGVASNLGTMNKFPTKIKLGNKYELLGEKADDILSKAKVAKFDPANFPNRTPSDFDVMLEEFTQRNIK